MLRSKWRLLPGVAHRAAAIGSVAPPVLRRVAAYYLPYRRSFALVLAIVLLNAALGVAPPLLLRTMIDRALPARDMGRLSAVVVGLLGVALLGALLGLGQRYLSARLGEAITFDLRRAVYGHLQRMSLRHFTNARTGELLSRLAYDVAGAPSMLMGTLLDQVTSAGTLTLALAVMITLEWRLALVAVAILPLFVLPVRAVVARVRALLRRQMEARAELNTMLGETLEISGVLLTRLFGRAADEQARFDALAGEVRDLAVRQAVIAPWFSLSLSLVNSVGLALVAWVGGHLLLSDRSFTVGTLVAFVVYLGQLYTPVRGMINGRFSIAYALVAFERIFEVLDVPVEIVERPDARRLTSVRGQLEVEHVWFSYTAGDPGGGPRGAGLGDEATPPAHRFVLRDISFTASPGQMLALVGPSGAGKTTLAYLLPRLYDPTMGRITLDGHDIVDLTLDTLSAHIGMVTQECYLFHDTIRANLLYARPGASDEDLRAACIAANIHDYIAALPHGYDTMVGERGYRLSGGEKQRLAIARVLLQDPPILILDEATSALDYASEALVQAALVRVMTSRTTLVIAHRLSTIIGADAILVLDDGVLVEHGTHAELLARGDLYARLYRTQFGAP